MLRRDGICGWLGMKFTAANYFNDLSHDLARGLFDFQGKRGAEIEIAAADAEQGGARFAAVKRFAQRQHVGWRQIMCDGVTLETWSDRGAVDWLGRFGDGRGPEKDGIAVADGFRPLQFPLGD